MQGIVTASGQVPVYRNQLLHAAHLAGQDDPVPGQADLLGLLRAVQGGYDQRLLHDAVGIPGFGQLRVLVHHVGGEFLVQAAPVHADAYRLVILDGLLDEDGELAVALPAETHVARIDAVLGERLGAIGVFRQQQVAVVMEIPDQGRVAAQRIQPLPDTGNLARRILVIHGDAHQLRPGGSQLLHLFHRRHRIGGIGIRHGLHDDGGAAAHRHRPDADRHTAPPC